MNCVEREIVSIDFLSSRSTLSLSSFYCTARNEKLRKRMNMEKLERAVLVLIYIALGE